MSKPGPETESRTRVPRDGSGSIVSRLRAMILSGEIPPGAIFSQLEMARRLGVSTTPLREAMRELQAEGLLEAEQNRRPRVPELNVDDLHAVYATRILLESLAVALTVREMTDADVDHLADNLEKMRRLPGRGGLPGWEAAHGDFHQSLLIGATPALLPAITTSYERAERYRRLSMLSDQPQGWAAADDEHERILDACRARRPEMAAGALAVHLARTAIALSAGFAPEIDPVPVRFALRLMSSAGEGPSAESRPRAGASTLSGPRA